ncbi:MAG: hypothetical protein UX27_C0043G0003 [Candidatus Azambacteria bacterium GW2011_GWA2_45_90]|uniref:Permease n=1 Tax=Candidatus Azambacteria bacterium GW2011_GWA2_45_90 TaxID=1618614 RepID=A0A0G1N914_9BACT|nr:MAG: hypothetical protein UX27_C0043G0003 [Candidatus Azambacteria bacterium GW2011_GWA2_45_90]
MRDIAAILFLALVIASAIDPLAQWFEKKGVSRIFTVLAVYLTAFGLIGLLVYLIVPVLLTEIRELSAVMPAYVEKINSFIRTIQPATEQNLTETLKGFLRQLEGSLGLVASNSLEAVIAVFGGITSLVLTVVISFYLSIQPRGIDNFLRALTPLHYEEYVMDLWTRSKRKIGRWAQGQLLLGFVVGVAVYIGLLLLGVKYALVLAIIAGIAELMPIVGVLISGTIAVLLAAVQDLFLGAMVLLLFVIIQQFENHVIVPQVMRKIVGLSPVVVILSLLIGFRLGGILGMLISVPVAAMLSEFWSDFVCREIWRERLKFSLEIAN